MDEVESRDWRNRLGEVLTQYNLHWVVEQVDQYIRLGRTSDAEIQTFSERRARSATETASDPLIRPPTPAYSPGRKARFVATRDFAPNEMLEIIIDAVERGVADTAEMEAEMLKQFEHGGVQYQVVLVREDPVSMRTVVSPNDAVSRAGSASRLRDLLRELRAEI